MSHNISNLVRTQLLRKGRESGRPFQELLQYYGLERFLYRLSRSKHAGKFLLKGALMLRVWNLPDSRTTRDIDLLGFGNNKIEEFEVLIRDVCNIDVDNDGVRFDPATIAAKQIKESAEYRGLRIKLLGYLEKSRIPIQLDIGFGDAVHPKPQKQIYPTILDFPSPCLRMYPKETVIAEKFEAMVSLGMINSRLKDFFDIWFLSRHFDFDGAVLATAINKTFVQRNTALSAELIALNSDFDAHISAQNQWGAFLKRT